MVRLSILSSYVLLSIQMEGPLLGWRGGGHVRVCVCMGGGGRVGVTIAYEYTTFQVAAATLTTHMSLSLARIPFAYTARAFPKAPTRRVSAAVR